MKKYENVTAEQENVTAEQELASMIAEKIPRVNVDKAMQYIKELVIKFLIDPYTDVERVIYLTTHDSDANNFGGLKTLKMENNAANLYLPVSKEIGNLVSEFSEKDDDELDAMLKTVSKKMSHPKPKKPKKTGRDCTKTSKTSMQIAFERAIAKAGDDPVFEKPETPRTPGIESESSVSEKLETPGTESASAEQPCTAEAEDNKSKLLDIAEKLVNITKELIAISNNV